MKILSWNCRGFVRAAAIRSLRALCRIHNPDVLFLCETKVKLFEAQNSLTRIGFPFFSKFLLWEQKGDWFWPGRQALI
ncbi:hypothetical protein SLA2020_262160 [Shorea laevis]